MLAHANDWEIGHSPVTTGRAPWLTTPFIQAMHYVRRERAEQTYLAAERARSERKIGG